MQVDDRDEYYKTAIGVETGYTTDVYIIRISHNKIERRPAINDQVVFTGVEGRLEYNLGNNDIVTIITTSSFNYDIKKTTY